MFRNKRVFAVLAVLMCVMTVFGTFGVFATEAETETDVTPGYAVYAVEVLEEDADADLSTLAQSYIDNYDSAIGSDPDVETNYKAAVEQVRKDVTPFYASIWSILPPVIAIVLALITKVFNF